MGIFAPESKLSLLLNKIGDLVILNILTLICCIPIVTIGAAITSMYQITLKMAKNEEGKIAGPFFAAMKENLKKSTIIWLIGLGLSLFLALDIYMLGKVDASYVSTYKIILFAFMVLILLFTYFCLVTAARFENTLKMTIRNGMIFCAIHFIKSILMFAVTLIPVALIFVSYRFLSIDVLVGLSGPAFLTSIYFRNLFAQFEGTAEEETTAEEM